MQYSPKNIKAKRGRNEIKNLKIVSTGSFSGATFLNYVTRKAKERGKVKPELINRIAW